MEASSVHEEASALAHSSSGVNRPRESRHIGQKIAYACGNLGQAAFYNALNTFFVTYVTTAMFIHVSKQTADRMIGIITGLIVAIRIAEIFLDPLLGNLIDNTTTRIGRFRPWQFIGGGVSAVLMAIIFTGMFGLVNVDATWFIVLFVICFIVLDVTYSLRDISYWGMIPSLSSDSGQRSIYTTLAELTGSIGYNGVTVIVVPIVSWFTYKFTGQWVQGQPGWAAFGVIIAAIGLATAWGVGFGTRELQSGVRAKAEKNGGPIEAFKAIAHNDQLLWTGLSYVLYSLANVTTVGLLFYQFTYVLGQPEKFSLVGIIPVIAGLVVTPLYPILNKWIPRKWLYVGGLSMIIVGYVLLIINPMNLANVFVGLVLYYVPSSLIQMVAILTMTDSIEYGQLKTGKRNEAVTLSVRPMLDKIAGAFANGIVGSVAVAAGMVGSAKASAMTPANIATFKLWAYIVPLIGVACSIVIFLLTVKIDEKEHARIVKVLEEEAEQSQGSDGQSASGRSGDESRLDEATEAAGVDADASAGAIITDERL